MTNTTSAHPTLDAHFEASIAASIAFLFTLFVLPGALLQILASWLDRREQRAAEAKAAASNV